MRLETTVTQPTLLNEVQRKAASKGKPVSCVSKPNGAEGLLPYSPSSITAIQATVSIFEELQFPFSSHWRSWATLVPQQIAQQSSWQGRGKSGAQILVTVKKRQLSGAWRQIWATGASQQHTSTASEQTISLKSEVLKSGKTTAKRDQNVRWPPIGIQQSASKDLCHWMPRPGGQFQQLITDKNKVISDIWHSWEKPTGTFGKITAIWSDYLEVTRSLSVHLT